MDIKGTRGKTISVIPFHLKSKNCIEQFYNFLDSRKYLKGLIKLKANSDYYQNHIQNIWSCPEDGYIESYPFDLNILNNQEFAPIRAKGFRFKFVDIQIILNSKRSYKEKLFGYFIVTYEWLDDFDLKSFSNLDFLRFHSLTIMNKYNEFTKVTETKQDKVNKPSSALQNNTRYLADILNLLLKSNEEIQNGSCWDDFSKYVSFPHKRSYLMHIFQCDERVSFRTNQLEAYKMIRIPKKGKSMELDQSFEHWINPLMINGQLDFTTEFYAMSEGVLLIDYNNEKVNEITNNYFPAFLLALNQRETQLMITSEFSRLSTKIIQGKENPRYDLAELRKMDGDFIKIRFDQFFKSVSRNTEVDSFFKSLRKMFLVEEILEDNEEKIRNLKALVAEAEKEDLEAEKERLKINQEKKEKEDLMKEKRSERRLNGLLFIIAAFSVLSAVNDTFDLFSISKDDDWLQPFYGICVAFGIIVIVYLLYSRKRLERD